MVADKHFFLFCYPLAALAANFPSSFSCHHKVIIVTPRRSKYECAECDNATMLRRGGLPLFIGPCGV